MFAWLIRSSLKFRFLVLAAYAALLVFGTQELRHMPVDVFPDLTAPTVTILTEGHGMAPDEMESLVTFPIEAAINGASGVRRVRSATAEPHTTGHAMRGACDGGASRQRLPRLIFARPTAIPVFPEVIPCPRGQHGGTGRFLTGIIGREPTEIGGRPARAGISPLINSWPAP